MKNTNCKQSNFNIKPIKLIAALLSVAVIISLFAGVTFADTDRTEGFSETVVIENGKLISGNSDLIEQGIIVLDSSDNEMGDDSQATPLDKELMQSVINTAVNNTTSDRADIKDTALLGNSTSSNKPTQTPSAVSPSVPVESANAVASITHTINTTLSKITQTASIGNNDSTKRWLTLNTTNYTAALKNASAGVQFNNWVQINYGITVGSGKTLELSCGMPGNYDGDKNQFGFVRTNQTSDLDLFKVEAGGVLRIVGYDSSVKGRIHLNGGARYGSYTDYPETIGSTTVYTCPKSILYVNGGTAEIKNATFLNNILRNNSSATKHGSAIHMTSGALHLENVWFYNCETSSAQNGVGGAIYIKSGTVTIKNCHFGGTGAEKVTGGAIDGQHQDLWATRGGSIYIADGNVTMEGGSAVNTHVASGTNSHNGGFAYVAGGTFNLKNVTIGSSTDSATVGAVHRVEANGDGGAIYVTKGTLELDGCTVQNCDAYNSGSRGGAIYSTGAAAVTITGSTIKGNEAADRGGGIASFSTNVTISNSTISGNKAMNTSEGLGGGIYFSTSGYKLTLEGCTVSSNQTGSRGAGMYITGQGAAELKGNTIVKSNIAGKEGGAIDLYNGATLVAENTYFYGNQSSISGGAISLTPAGNAATKATLTNCYIGITETGTASANTATTSGGAVYVGTGGALILNGGTQISNNKANGGDGGGIHITSGSRLSVNGTQSNKVIISKNEAYQNGGGIYLNTSKGINPATDVDLNTVEINYAEIKENTAKTSEGDGGGIYTTATNLKISNSLIDGNKALTDNSNGGGIHFGSNNNLNVINCVISNNLCYGWGGGLYCPSSSTIKVEDSTFDANKSRQGGGIMLYGKTASMTITNTYMGNNQTIDSVNSTNKASVGGAIVLIRGSATIDNTKIGWLKDANGNDVSAPNKAAGGAGIYVDSNCTLILNENVNISNNISNGNGGGISIDGTDVSSTDADQGPAKIQINGTAAKPVVINNNQANNGSRGGGVYLYKAKGPNADIITFSNVFVNDNTATDAGGGICVDTSHLKLVGVNQVNSNTAAWYGGGICIRVNKTTDTLSKVDVNIDDNDSGSTQINGNNVTGHYGGGVHVSSTGESTFRMKGGTINDNISANQSGGGIDSQNVVELTGTEIKDNEARSTGGIAYGGGICARGSKANVTLTRCTVESNEGQYGGGITVIDNAVLVVDNTDIIYNDAKGGVNTEDELNSCGGGIFAEANCTLEIKGADGSVSYNYCDYQGGGIYIFNIDNGNKISIKDVTFEENETRTDRGGAIYIDYYEGDVYKNNDKTNPTVFENVKFIKNVSDNGEIADSQNYGHGGGVYYIRCRLEIKNCEFIENNASHRGGGFYCTGSDSYSKLYNCLIDQNTSYYYGGGVGAYNGALIELELCDITGNISDTNGGGISADMDAVVSLDGCTVSGNKALTGNGGGIYILGNTATITISITDTEIYGNEAMNDVPRTDDFTIISTSMTGMGGGIYISGENAQLDLTDTAIGKNGSPNKAGYGAGVAVQRGAAVTATNVDCCYNEAIKSGGGYYVLSDAQYGIDYSVEYTTTLNVSGGSISNNLVTFKDKNGVTIQTKDFVIGGAVEARDMSSELGGGAALVRSFSSKRPAQATFDGVLFEGNYSYHSAGGIYIHENASSTITDCDFLGNNARQFAGALYFPRTNATAAISDCNFDSNFAGIRGGCMYINANGITITDSVMKNNHVDYLGWGYPYGGGALFVSSGTGTNVSPTDLVLESVDFINNYATTTKNEVAISGGAILVQNAGTNPTTITLKKSANGDVCKFVGNSAHGNGGAITIFGANTTVNMEGGYIVGNSAGSPTVSITESPYQKAYKDNAFQTSGVGGAVAVLKGKFNLTVSSANAGAIYGNIAKTAGDDVFANGEASSSVTVPAVSAMTIYSGEVPENLPVVLPTSLAEYDWYEDYMTGDTNYASGLNGNSAYKFRYRETPLSILAPVSKINSTNYVSITVGVGINNTGKITITTPKTDDPDQRFVYTITATPLSGAPYTFTVSLLGGETVEITQLSAGTYSITQQTEWSWRCSVNGVAQTGGQSQAINGDTITFYLACSKADDTVSVTYSNKVDIRQWLSHNSPLKENKAQSTVAYRLDAFAEDKRIYV